MSLIKHIQKTYKQKKLKNWKYIYYTIDIHGTIFKPTHDYNNEQFKYYPFAKKTLQLISQQKDTKILLWSSTYPQNITQYINNLKENNINIDFINYNTDIKNNNISDFSFKQYTDIGIDDKFGFNPNNEWKKIYNTLKNIYKNI